jgi:hypothetical protein
MSNAVDVDQTRKIRKRQPNSMEQAIEQQEGKEEEVERTVPHGCHLSSVPL